MGFGMNEERAIVVKNQLSELERVSRDVEAFGEHHGLPANAIFSVNLALDEILTNVISYGYVEGGQHDIVLRLSLAAGELVVQVEDDGRAFNPLELRLPDMDKPLEERPIGGLGIHLVRKLMDRLEYRREAGRNVLVMAKAVH